MAKKIYEKTTETVDFNTGELSSVTKTMVAKVDSYPQFMQVYLSDLSGLMKIDTGAESKLLFILWSESAWNGKGSTDGNVITTVAHFKTKWAQQLECSVASVNNLLVKLVKKGLLIKKDKSVYALNPKYFFKGFVEDRSMIIQVLLKYQIKDTSIVGFE